MEKLININEQNRLPKFTECPNAFPWIGYGSTWDRLTPSPPTSKILANRAHTGCKENMNISHSFFLFVRSFHVHHKWRFVVCTVITQFILRARALAVIIARQFDGEQWKKCSRDINSKCMCPTGSAKKKMIFSSSDL